MTLSSRRCMRQSTTRREWLLCAARFIGNHGWWAQSIAHQVEMRTETTLSSAWLIVGMGVNASYRLSAGHRGCIWLTPAGGLAQSILIVLLHNSLRHVAVGLIPSLLVGLRVWYQLIINTRAHSIMRQVKSVSIRTVIEHTKSMAYSPQANRINMPPLPEMAPQKSTVALA